MVTHENDSETDSEKSTPFWHRQAAQGWMITSFVTVLLSFTFALPLAYAIDGVRSVTQSEPHHPAAEPVMPTVPAPEPERYGFPVALTNATAEGE